MYVGAAWLRLKGIGKRNTYCFGLMEPHFGGLLRETKSLLFCGSGAENNSVQTLSSAVSLRKDKHSNGLFASSFVFGGRGAVVAHPSISAETTRIWEPFIFAERLVMLINKQQFWSIDSTQLKYFRQKWIVSTLGIKQQIAKCPTPFNVFIFAISTNHFLVLSRNIHMCRKQWSIPKF